ncbi:MAG: HIT family protein [Chloroflexota bacterium]|nr:HIT family protein [Chloroflexota bacterium]
MDRGSGEEGCPCCDFIRSGRPLAERGTVVAMVDRYPVSQGHTLLIPKRHVETVFALTEEEREDLFHLLLEVRDLIRRRHRPDGFNLGVNVGAAAGQTIAHVHVHVIPRYEGDVENPTGGVRGVIPGRADYRSGV